MPIEMSDQLTGREGTRERIVEAARELFFEQGYNATGMSQILNRAEANSGSLYHFFPTKEDLLVAVLEKYKLMLCPMVIEPAKQYATDPVDRLFAILMGYRMLLEATEFRLGCPIGNLALELSNSHPRARQLIEENFEGWVREVRAIVDEVSDRLPEGMDAECVATLLLSAMEGGVMLARTYRSLEPFDRTVHAVRLMFDQLVRGGSEWSAPLTITSPP